MNHEPVPPELVIDGTNQSLVVTRGGEELFRGSPDDLTASSKRPDWLVLHGGERIRVPIPGAATAILCEFAPSEELSSILDGLQYEEPYCDEMPGERTPLRADIFVNDRPWGWVELEPTDRWQLLPGDFQEQATTLLRISLWQSASMTGMVTETAVRWARPVALLWDWNDIDGTKYTEIRYDAEDPQSLAERCTDVAFPYWSDTVCPCCEDDGWVLSVDTSDELGEDFVGKVIARMWQPCTEHAATADEWALAVGYPLWRWSDGAWVRLGEADPEPPTVIVRA